MASYTKTTSGSNTTYVITDETGAVATVVVSVGAVTGQTVQYSGAAVHYDAINMINQFGLLWATGLLPG